jgi:hypothetical protein
MSSALCRWQDLVEAAKTRKADAQVLDASGSGSFVQRSAVTVHTSDNAYPHVNLDEVGVPLKNGGFLVNKELMNGFGTLNAFPPGNYMIQVVATDEHGVSGNSIVGALCHCSWNICAQWRFLSIFKLKTALVKILRLNVAAFRSACCRNRQCTAWKCATGCEHLYKWRSYIGVLLLVHSKVPLWISGPTAEGGSEHNSS